MKLFVFPHSHFCEKAQWALDYKGAASETVAVVPGFHIVTLSRYAPGTMVPLLLDGSKSVQGSGEIIDYLDQKMPERPLTPSDEALRLECVALEDDAERRIGKPLRTMLYSWLLDHPAFLRKCFTHSMPPYKKVLFDLVRPILFYKIHQIYVKSPQYVERARGDFDAVMVELAERVAAKPYLVGDQFSRADLAVASLLSLLVLPDEHPFPWGDVPDERVRLFMDEFRDHPVSEWVREIYRQHRGAA